MWTGSVQERVVAMQVAIWPFEEGVALSAGHAYYLATEWTSRHPDL